MKHDETRKMIVYQVMTRLFGNTRTFNKPFGTISENGSGKFNDITKRALDSIRNLGVTHIWFTGVIEHATMTDYTAYNIPLDDADVVKGRAGSPYAIKDYYDVDPDLAINVSNRMTEFEDLIRRTHEAGLEVIIDFVPNHVARKYHSDVKPSGIKDLGETDDQTKRFLPTNNFYYLPGEAFVVPKGYQPLGPGGKHPTFDGKFKEIPAKVTGDNQLTATPTINNWFETVKLNYGVDLLNHTNHFDPIPDTWVKMKDILVFWTQKKVDGFRCDMAEMVPVEFWAWVIPQIKAVNPEVTFIAEIYNPQQYRAYLNQGKFDFLYDKVQMYDTLRFMLNGHRTASDVAWIYEELADVNGKMLHFLENHDEQRIASPQFVGDPWKAVPAMVVSATIDKGPVMIYFGQEVGEPGAGAEGFQGNDGRTTIYDYWGVPEHQKWLNNGKYDGGLLSDSQKKLRLFYQRILTFASTQPAIHSGAYYDLTRMNSDSARIDSRISAYFRYTDSEAFLMVSNFNPEPKTFNLFVPDHALNLIGIQTPLSAKNLLDGTTSFTIGKDGNLPITINAYTSFILKIK